MMECGFNFNYICQRKEPTEKSPPPAPAVKKLYRGQQHHQSTLPDAEEKHQRRRYHIITADSDDDNSAGIPVAHPEQMQRRNTWIASYGEEEITLRIEHDPRILWNHVAPLEVSGNRLPETGSKRTLLHARGACREATGPARADILAGTSEFGRASCCVNGLSQSPLTACLACTQYPSAEKLSPFYYRCHKDIFLARQTIVASS
ncbi:hypothetical protein V6N11_034870 [Hibiscus sabdariffa]|uniref:Uncharacterized protein n=1 Tax=Hibiscus sabdariffa TaxID=183260 RepID=A0ABR2AI28_9ROSI